MRKFSVAKLSPLRRQAVETMRAFREAHGELAWRQLLNHVTGFSVLSDVPENRLAEVIAAAKAFKAGESVAKTLNQRAAGIFAKFNRRRA